MNLEPQGPRALPMDSTAAARVHGGPPPIAA
jgi:hypothetical protein